MRIHPATLAKSIGELATLDADQSFEDSMNRVLTCAKVLFATDAVGIMLLAEDGQLRWISALDDRSQMVEDAQERLAQGPCQQAFADRTPVAIADNQRAADLDQIGEAMAAAGIRAALSVPVEVQGGPVGTLDLYSTSPRDWDDGDTAAAHAYAGVLGSLLVTALTAYTQSQLAAQLQVALDTRVLIEQAKGVLMASLGIDAQTAWARLRNQARSTNRRVVDVASELIQTIPGRRQPVGST